MTTTPTEEWRSFKWAEPQLITYKTRDGVDVYARLFTPEKGRGEHLEVWYLVGAWFLVDRYLNIDSALLFPAVLIVIGGALVIGALARSGGRGPS